MTIAAAALGASQSPINTNIINEDKKPSAWYQAAYGAAMLPASLVVQTATVGLGILLERTNIETISAVFNPEACTGNLPLEQSIAIKAHLFETFNSLIPREEFFCRVLVHDILLKKAPHKLISKIAPNYEYLVDSTPAKIARILISSGVFSAIHLVNAGIPGMTPSMLNFQLFNTFGMGLVLGALQEKTGNAWASVGLHMAYNNFFLLYGFRNC